MELAVDLCDEIVILNKGQLSLINKEDLDDDAFQEKIIKILKDEDHAWYLSNFISFEKYLSC